MGDRPAYICELWGTDQRTMYVSIQDVWGTDQHTYVSMQDVWGTDQHTYVSIQDVWGTDQRTYVSIQDVWGTDQHTYVWSLCMDPALYTRTQWHNETEMFIVHYLLT